jgi:hypothetical protein
MEAALALAIQALEVLPPLISAGADALGFIDSTTSALKVMQAENRDPTDTEWAALNAQIATLRLQLDGAAGQAPTPVAAA